ncbi:MAG: hypothetical protein KDD70_01895 [Bdellovibrionales bacterium]|nr:hypothetical protein [Bdellovibrionales bacterium]
MTGNQIALSFGDVREKSISTPNHFVSHMVEHIAWRMGLTVKVLWEDEDWFALGTALGQKIRSLPQGNSEAIAFGMIDDGSATVAVERGEPSVEWSAVGGVDLEWFLQLRCEQIDSGTPLVSLLEGLSCGLGARITIEIWALEDPHHTWEGIYRGVGIALSHLFYDSSAIQSAESNLEADSVVFKNDDLASEIAILEYSAHSATVRRGTAETGITVQLNLRERTPCSFQFEVDQSIGLSLTGMETLLQRFASQLGAHLSVQFSAKTLSSSHVVMEDIGLVLGRALLEIMKYRMLNHGIQGAGSNISREHASPVEVGVSVEGRKFWRLIPEDGNFNSLRKELLIGHTILGGCRSEDLDDFIDGLSGGLSASIALHIRISRDAEKTWLSIFSALGEALRKALQPNPYRKGVPPGVKATLA